MAFADQLASAFVPIAAAYDDASRDRALTWAKGFVEAYCNRVETGGFDLVSDDVAYVDPATHHRALVPGLPVLSVTSVEGFMPAPSGGLDWVPLTNYAFVSETGLIYDTTGQPGTSWSISTASWPWLPGSLKITYDHGYSTVPQPLIDTACRLAQQYLENPGLKLARKVGDMQDTFFGGYSTGANIGSVGVVLNALDRAVLDRFTLVSIA